MKEAEASTKLGGAVLQQRWNSWTARQGASNTANIYFGSHFIKMMSLLTKTTLPRS